MGQLAVRAIGAWQRRVARARGIRAPRTGEAPDVLAQVQAEAAATWRSPADGRQTVRGGARLPMRSFTLRSEPREELERVDVLAAFDVGVTHFGRLEELRALVGVHVLVDG